MEPKILRVSRDEHNLIVNAAKDYGNVFVNTHDLVIFSWDFVDRVEPKALAFILFLGQFQKSITLSFLSALRNHEVQFQLMLRQSLEAAALASFGLHNPNIDEFGRPDEDDCLFANRKVTGKAYNWLEKNYPEHSKSMKFMKNQINESYAHANLLPTSDNIQSGANKIGLVFFDKPDPLFTMQHLWWIGNIIIGILDLFEKIIMKYPIATLSHNFQDKMKKFSQENTKTKLELQANPRFSRWASKM